MNFSPKNQNNLSRRGAAALAVGTLTLGLVACSGAEEEASACALGSGPVVEALAVSGDHGTQLTVDGQYPLAQTGGAQLAVLDRGTGDELVAADTNAQPQHKVKVTGIDGTTGETLFHETVESAVGEQAIAPMLKNLAGCATDNGRLVLALPVGDLWPDPSAVGLTMMAPADTFLLAMDFDGQVEPPLTGADLLPQAQGIAGELPLDFPTVTVAENGQPTITMPDAAPPAEFKIGTLIQGEGETVQPGDTVYVHYTGVLWSTGKEFDSSWTRGQAISFETTGVIPGFQKALEGQKVGSRVVALIPPEEGYGSDWLISNGGTAEDAMVFVIDIVGTQHN